MNKKVLTLCAGVLLVSGSAVFTVNALNAGGEKVQTAYVADLRAGSVVGYNLVAADPEAEAADVTIWSLVETKEGSGKYYLSPKEGYYVAKDGTIVEGTKGVTKPATVTIMSNDDNYAVSLDGKNAWAINDVEVYLWKEDGSKLTKTSEVETLTLDTEKEAYKDLVADGDLYVVSYTSKDGSPSVAKTGEDFAVGTTNTWKWESSKYLYLSRKSGSTTEKLYLYNENGTIKVSKDDKSAVSYDGESLLIGGEKVYISSKSFTTKSSSAQPAALYPISKSKVDPQPENEAVTSGSFVIAQRVETTVADTKFNIQAAEAIEGSTVGTEYGPIKNVQFTEDGVLNVIADVNDAEVPVYISYKSGNETYYLMSNGKWGPTKTQWILRDGILVNLDTNAQLGTEKNPVKYTRTEGTVGISGVDVTGIEKVTIEVSKISLKAEQFNECDIPLLADENEDYIVLGGQDATTGAPSYITYNPSTGFGVTTDYTAAELWKVTKHPLTNGRYSYTFTSRQYKDAAGKPIVLKVGNYTSFAGWDYTSGVQLIGIDNAGNIETSVIIDNGQLVAQYAAATVLGFYQSPVEQYTAQWLMHRYGSSFQLNFTNYDNHANKTWTDNIFEGVDLVPVAVDFINNTLTEVTPENEDILGKHTTQFLLKKKGSDLYIALDVTTPVSNVIKDMVNTGGYRFQLLSEEHIKEVVFGRGQVNNITYYPFFRINYLEGQTEYTALSGHDFINNDILDPEKTDPYCIEVGNGNSWPYDVIIVDINDDVNSDHLNLYVTVNDHCENDDRRVDVTFYTDDENIVRGEDKENNPLNYRYVNIAFKASRTMQFYNNGAKVNLDGKVLGISENGGHAVPTEKEYFLSDKAEGQWAVSMTDVTKSGTSKDGIDTRKFTFTNRENKAADIHIAAMHYMGNNMYAVEYDTDYNDGPFGIGATRDTLIITPAKGNLKLTAKEDAFNMDSYANWTKEDLQDKTFQLSIDAAAQLYVTENEGKDSHFLGLTDDALEVTNWRLVPFTAARVHDVDAAKYLTAGTDSVYTMSQPQYYDGGKFYIYTDTTATITYALQNIQNNEWLTYDPSQSQTILSMICDPNSKNYTTANLNEAYRFVLKEKAEGAQKIESGEYNIIGVDAWVYGDNGKSKYVQDGAAGAYYELDLSKKLYGATTYQKLGAVEVKGAYEDPTSNDIFTIATTASQEYVKATPMDTVRIYGAEDNNYLLYENNRFLNLSNANGIAPAMVLDTAYYDRPGNNRYQYLIVVNPHYTEPVYDQLHGGDYHLVTPEKMEGRFLVNMIDSAVAVARNHNNPYINDIEADQKELKLGFEWGYRTQDTLFLTKGQGGEVVDTIPLGTPDFNKAKFAFKYVNQAASDEFKVQTAFYDYDAAVKAGDSNAAGVMNNEGYLKSVNGVIVVTEGYTHGEEFLMAQENSDPTANESITAEGAVSVTATDGAVVIKGAEGKNVIIATILGKVVANETINSDNETIAVPAGIAVVSVDGESFKVVVK